MHCFSLFYSHLDLVRERVRDRDLDDEREREYDLRSSIFSKISLQFISLNDAFYLDFDRDSSLECERRCFLRFLLLLPSRDERDGRESLLPM